MARKHIEVPLEKTAQWLMVGRGRERLKVRIRIRIFDVLAISKGSMVASVFGNSINPGKINTGQGISVGLWRLDTLYSLRYDGNRRL